MVITLSFCCLYFSSLITPLRFAGDAGAQYHHTRMQYSLPHLLTYVSFLSPLYLMLSRLSLAFYSSPLLTHTYFSISSSFHFISLTISYNPLSTNQNVMEIQAHRQAAVQHCTHKVPPLAVVSSTFLLLY